MSEKTTFKEETERDWGVTMCFVFFLFSILDVGFCWRVSRRSWYKSVDCFVFHLSISIPRWGMRWRQIRLNWIDVSWFFFFFFFLNVFVDFLISSSEVILKYLIILKRKNHLFCFMFLFLFLYFFFFFFFGKERTGEGGEGLEIVMNDCCMLVVLFSGFSFGFLKEEERRRKKKRIRIRMRIE